MKLWKQIVETSFPGTYQEYIEAKKIHREEIKKYRKNWQFIVGLILYVIPLLILIVEPGWRGKVIALLVAVGEMLIRDTISEHYCAIIYKERKNLSMQSSD
jgi:hypothetical protein